MIKYYNNDSSQPTAEYINSVFYESTDELGRFVFRNRIRREKVTNSFIDGNTENNFIWNIKPLTNSENQQKRKINENNTSGYRGVSFRMDREKWSARIKVGDKYLSLGLYENIIDAAMAYNKAALIYFGEYAQLNEIRGL